MRLATYNIHKARGLDGRVRWSRIAAVLLELHADAVALQEVLASHLEQLQRRLGGHWAFAPARDHAGEPYGNATWSRWPIQCQAVVPLTIPGHEPRIALRADIDAGGRRLHMFNLHLGMHRNERRQQAALLLHPNCLHASDCAGVRVVLGDLNEATRGPVTQQLCHAFSTPRPRPVYPPLCPLLPLDQIHCDPSLRPIRLQLHRSRLALLASDHAPLLADLGGAGAPPTTPTRSA